MMEFKIQTRRLLLREVLAGDLSAIHAINSLPEVDYYNTLGIPENLESTRKLVSDIIESQEATERIRYVFAILEAKGQTLIGLCGLVIGKPKYQNAELWYKLHPDYWNRGYATEATLGLLNFGFSELKLHRIEAGCATENIASIRVLEKSGFLKEGRTRKLLPIRGAWFDNFGYAILEEDFFKKEG